MPRKKLTKKATHGNAKVKMKAKKAPITVAYLLKQLATQLKKELAALKKKANKLTLTLKRTEKQKKVITAALAKKPIGRKLTITKKINLQTDRVIASLVLELKTITHAITSLSEKQAALTLFNKPAVKKLKNKLKKVKMKVKAKVGKVKAKIVKAKKKPLEKLKALAPALPIYEEPTPVTSTSELEEEVNA